MEKWDEERESFESRRNYNTEQESLTTRREQHPKCRGGRESPSQEKGLVPDRRKGSQGLERCMPRRKTRKTGRAARPDAG